MAGPLPVPVVESIIRLADGSPFMASAVLRGLAESGALLREADGWKVDALKIGEVQSSSQAATFLARRLELLPPETLRLLARGAVLGKEFELNIAAEMADQSPAQSHYSIGCGPTAATGMAAARWLALCFRTRQNSHGVAPLAGRGRPAAVARPRGPIPSTTRLAASR